jgi:hypothetical protein
MKQDVQMPELVRLGDESGAMREKCIWWEMRILIYYYS